jgi:hypothetical protein
MTDSIVEYLVVADLKIGHPALAETSDESGEH